MTRERMWLKISELLEKGGWGGLLVHGPVSRNGEGVIHV